MEKVNYIWITWESSSGSAHSMLWYNGYCSYAEAKRAIDGTDTVALFKASPSWMNCVRVRMTAQNLHTGNTLYKRVITKRPHLD